MVKTVFWRLLKPSVFRKVKNVTANDFFIKLKGGSCKKDLQKNEFEQQYSVARGWQHLHTKTLSIWWTTRTSCVLFPIMFYYNIPPKGAGHGLPKLPFEALHTPRFEKKMSSSTLHS